MYPYNKNELVMDTYYQLDGKEPYLELLNQLRVDNETRRYQPSESSKLWQDSKATLHCKDCVLMHVTARMDKIL